MVSVDVAKNGLTFRIPFPHRRNIIAPHDDGVQPPSSSPTQSASTSLRFTIPISQSGSSRGRRPPLPQISPVLSDDELAVLELSGLPSGPSSDDVDRIVSSASLKLAQLERVLPCAVCEMSFGSHEVIPVPLSSLLLQAMKMHLSPRPSDNISQYVLRQYDASDIDARLSGLMLYPPGISIQDNIRLLLCANCHDCLNKKNPTLPRMAIANGNFIGWYDDEKLTWLEEQMVALVSPCMSVTSIAGGRHRCIRSHHYIVKNTAGPPISMLPENATDHIRVAMVGAMTPDQIAKCKTRYAVDVPRCKRALALLCREHTNYSSEEVRNACATRLSRARQVNVVVDHTRDSSDPVDQNSVDDMEDTTSYNHPESTRAPNATIESQWIEERTVLLDDSSQTSDLFFRKSNVFESARRWELAVQMFPLLFPSGRGGPSEPRKQQYSLQTWITRCLRLHRNRFEKHDVFLLLAFDYLALEAARKRMFVRLQASTDALTAGRVTPHVLKECMEYRRHLEEATAAGVQPTSPSATISSILKLQRGLYAGEVGYYGSDKSRAHGRNDIFGYIKRFGPLQLFFTISPDSSGTYAISCRTGQVDPDTVTRANAHLLPTRTTRRMTATSHPFQCAVYFDQVMSIVIENVLGWSTTHQRPKRKGGLFGFVKAFAASAETQVTGDLHAHFAVWLYGFPASATANEEALKNPEFRDAIAEFVDAISTTELPGVTEECLNPVCDGKIEPVGLPDSAFQKPKRGDQPCSVAVCNTCKSEYNSEMLLNSVIREDLSTSEADFIQCRPPANSPITDEELNVILRGVQVHRWCHTKSCFKVRMIITGSVNLAITDVITVQVTRRNPTGSFCRFQRPLPPNVSKTFLDKDNGVVHQRPIGSEYVNPYNKTLARLFRCNHDVRLVLSSTSKDVAAYICKYVMKPQNRIENETALALATYEQAVNSTNARIEPTEDNARTRGNSVYSSWLYRFTNRQDIAATLAALFILRESAFWFSHEVVRIHLGQLVSTFSEAQTEDTEATIQVSPEIVERTVPVYEYVNALQNYWKRPPNMEDLCLVAVLEWYDFKAGRYVKRDTRRVLVICGEPLPDIDVTIDPEERERYFKSLTMLFKPSRRAKCAPSASSFEQQFEHFIAHGESRAVRQAQFHVRSLADTHSARRASANDEDVPVGHPSTRYSSVAGLSADRPEQDRLDEDLVCSDTEADSAIPTIDEQYIRYTRILSTEHGVDGIIEDTARRQLVGFDETQHRVSRDSLPLAQPAQDDSPSFHGTTEFLRVYPTRESQLHSLEGYMNPIPWLDPSTHPRLQREDLCDFASIAEVSRAFQLNLQQHVAFETIARHVLYSYASDIATEGEFSLPIPPPTSGLKRQLIGFLGGEAGTGKSQVIHSLLEFAKLWKREGSVEAIAYTGVAAINVNGKTVHSARNIPVDSGKRPNISEEMKSKFSKVVLTICDEVSMLAQTLLGRADSATNELAPLDLNMPWAGRHLLFCGDWLQIPPVQGRPCHAKPPDSLSLSTRQGYELYSKINFVVFLVENMRNKLDPTYTDILSRLRWGRTTNEDLAALNTRVAQAVSSESDTPWYFHPIIVPTNQQRCAINHRMIYETAKSHGTRLFECAATPTSSRSVATLKKVEHLDDSCTSRIPLKLVYFFGMPVMLSQRSKPSEHATANGTVAFIAGHVLENETNPGTNEERNGCIVTVLHDTPRQLILKVLRSTTPYDDSLPPGHLFVEPLSKSIEVDIPRTSSHLSQSNKRPRSSNPTLTIRQFALVPAFACTPEKLQGLTCHDGVTLVKLERAKLPPQSLYVALSRTTSLDKLVLTQPIDIQFLKKFKPDKSAVSEIRRLLSKLHVPSYFSAEQRHQLEGWILTQSPP